MLWIMSTPHFLALGCSFNVRITQVLCLLRLNFRIPTSWHYLLFGLYSLQVYSGFGLSVSIFWPLSFMARNYTNPRWCLIFFPENFCFFNHNVHEDDFYIISMSTLILHSSLLIMTYCWQNLLLKNVCNEKKWIRCQYWTSWFV
jgi:hypothetical protein